MSIEGNFGWAKDLEVIRYKWQDKEHNWQFGRTVLMAPTMQKLSKEIDRFWKQNPTVQPDKEPGN